MQGVLIRRLRGKGKKDAIADAAITGAKAGSIRHIEFIFDRIDGLPARRTILEGGDSARPILIRRVKDDADSDDA